MSAIHLSLPLLELKEEEARSSISFHLLYLRLNYQYLGASFINESSCPSPRLSLFEVGSKRKLL